MKKNLILAATGILAITYLLSGCATANQTSDKGDTPSANETTASVNESESANSQDASESSNSQDASESSNETAAEACYESPDGWKVSYNTDSIYLNDMLGDGQIGFNYIGECSGTNIIIISYVPDKMPDEVLYEKTADYPYERIERSEGFFGTGNIWSHSRSIKPENTDPEKGDVTYDDFTAIEHNGGTILIEDSSHLETDDGRAMAISDTMAALLDSFEFTNHEPQTEYAGMVGSYNRTGTDEIEGQNITYTENVTLNEDHSCEMTVQDTISGSWTSTELIMDDGERYEFTIEGDELLLKQGDEWISYSRE